MAAKKMDGRRQLVELFEDVCKVKAEGAAFIKCSGQEVTYEEFSRLYQRCLRVMKPLLGQHEKTDVIAIMMPRSVEMIASALAAMKVGATFLLIDVTLPQARVQIMLQDCDTTLVLTSQRANTLTSTQSAYRVISLHDALKDRSIHSSPVINQSTTNNDSEGTPLTIVYTSGSTAEPKGVIVTGESVYNMFNWMWTTFPFHTDERIAFKTSVAFADCYWEMFGGLIQGIPTVIIPERISSDPRALLKHAHANKVSRLVLVPTMLNAMIPYFDTADNINLLEHLRIMVSSGESLSSNTARSVLELAPECTLLNLYGSSESGFNATFHVVSKEDCTTNVMIPIGRPIDNVGIRLEVEDGIDNYHLYVSGICLSSGYVKDPELTNKKYITIDDTRYFRTGDLVKRSYDGRMFCIGRNDRQIKVRGNRVNLDEIEDVLRKSILVSEAVVATIGSAESVKICALLQFSQDTKNWQHKQLEVVDKEIETELRIVLSKYLPQYMIPNTFYSVETLSKMSSGKLDRKKMAALIEETIDKTTTEGNSSEKNYERDVSVLHKIWTDKLGTGGKVDRSFLRSGGHSLLAFEMCAKIESEFSVVVPVSFFLQDCSVDELCAYVKNYSNTDQPSACSISNPSNTTNAYLATAAVSPQEQGILLHQVMHPKGTANNVLNLYKLKTSFCSSAFSKVIMDICEENRHVAGSYYAASHGSFMRRYLTVDASEGTIGGYQIISCISNVNEEAIKAHMREIEFDPFSGKPLIKFSIYTANKGNTYLGVAAHHIICDGTSIGLIIKQVISRLSGEESDHRLNPTENSQYQKYAGFCSYVYSEGCVEFEKRQEYWETEMEDSFPASLPAHFSESSVSCNPPNVAGLIHGSLTVEQTIRLEEMAKIIGVTPNLVFLTTLGAMLSTYNNTNDLILGVTTANRTLSEFMSSVGLFADLSVIRLRFDGNPSLRTLLLRTKDAFQQMLEYYIPYERLVSSLSDRKTHFESVKTVFTFQNALDVHPHQSAEPIEVYPAETKNDLEINVSYVKEKGVYSMSLSYKKSLFPHWLVEGFLEHWVNFIIRSSCDLDTPYKSIDILSENKKIKLQHHMRKTHAELPTPSTLDSLFLKQVKKTPNAIALEHGLQSFSYANLFNRVWRLRQQLQHNITERKCVGILMYKGVNTVVCCLASLFAGCYYVYIDPDLPDDRIMYILRDLKPAVVLTEDIKHLWNYEGQQLVVTTDNDNSSECDFGPDPYDTRNKPSDLCYITYTSGSTGNPKGVCVTHKCVVGRVKKAGHFNLDVGDRVGQSCSFSFDMAVFDLYASLTNGATLVLIDYTTLLSSSNAYIQTIKKLDLTMMCLPTALFHTISDYAISGVFSRLKYLFIAGEKPNEHKVRKVLEHGVGSFQSLYGPTEVTIYALSHTFSSKDKCIRNFLGNPLENTTIYIVNDNMQLVPPGVPGEIVIGGIGVTDGYHNLSEKTKRVFVPDCFDPTGEGMLYRTGDIGVRDISGNILFLERKDRQVKIRGHRIELGEVESAAIKYQAIDDAVAVITKDGNGENQIGLHVLVNSESQFHAQNLWKTLRHKLPSHAVPSYINPTSYFPVNMVGKIDRHKLKYSGFECSHLDSYLETPVYQHNKVQRVIRECFGKCVDFNLGFIENGGNSLLAVKISSICQSQLGLELKPLQLLTCTNIEEFVSKSFLHKEREVRADTANEETFKAAYDLKPPHVYCNTTTLQQELFLEHEKLPNSPRYNIPLVLQMDGELEKAMLKLSIRRLLQKHMVLRVRYKLKDDALIMEEIPEIELEECFRVTRIDKYTADRTVPEEVMRDIHIPFDLEAASPIRFHLYEFDFCESGIKKQIFSVVIHHIAADADSVIYLMRDLWCLYEDVLKKTDIEESPILESVSPQLRQAGNEMDNPNGEADINFWTENLQGMQPLQFPYATQPTTLNGTGGVIILPFDEKLTEQMMVFCNLHQLTPASVLLTVLKCLLCKTSRQDDIIVAVTFSTRSHGCSNFGPNIRTFPVRTNFGMNRRKSFCDLAKTVLQNLLACSLHLKISLSDIVSSLRKRTAVDPGEGELADALLAVMFNFTEMKVDDFLPKGFLKGHIVNIERDMKCCKNPLSWDFQQVKGKGNITGTITYDDSMFHRDVITSLGEGYMEFLKAALKKSTSPPWISLPLVSGDLYKQHCSESQVYQHTNLMAYADQLKTTFKEAPNAVAVINKDKSISYGDLYDKSAMISHIISTGSPTSIIGVCMNRGIELTIVMVGIVLSGKPFVYMDPTEEEGRLLCIKNDTNCKTVFVDLAGSKALGIIPELSLHHVEDMDLIEYEQHPKTVNAVAIDLANPFAYIYTSGTTGTSKGVSLSNKAVVQRLHALNSKFEMTRDSKVAQVNSFRFDATFLDFWMPLMFGATVVMVEQSDLLSPLAFETLLHQAEIDICALGTAVFNFLASHNPAMFKSVQVLSMGGEKACKTTINKVLSTGKYPGRFFNVYGPTEAMCISTMHNLAGYEPFNAQIGKPVPGCLLQIVDKYGSPVPLGLIGELWIGGEGLLTEYLNQPVLTKERLTAYEDGAMYYHTGDLVKMDADGCIHYIGREDGMVKIHGYRVDTHEVGKVLLRHPQILQVHVMSMENASKSNEHELVAFYVSENNEIPPRDLSVHCRDSLPRHMIPSRFVLVENFPLTLSQKVDSNALAKISVQPNHSSCLMKTSSSKASCAVGVRAIWGNVLSRDIDEGDDGISFFELGGSSLSLFPLKVQLEEHFRVTVTVADLFQFKTISEQAHMISGRLESVQPYLQPSVADGDLGNRTCEIAVVGIACKYPKSDNAEEFWENIVSGTSCLAVHSTVFKNSKQKVSNEKFFVPVSGHIENQFAFDNEFFSMSFRESALTDPQHRQLLQVSYHALEDAGIIPNYCSETIGIFIGVGENIYKDNVLMKGHLTDPDVNTFDEADSYNILRNNLPDTAPALVAYKLGLTGPALCIQSACASSLAAIHMARRAIQSGDCNIALAGGVDLACSETQGYVHQNGMITSPSGNCCPFDKSADGTVGSCGIGVIVMMSSEQALNSRRRIYGHIIGSALNNDGWNKISFSASNLTQQTAVVRAARDDAGFTEGHPVFVEAHGSGVLFGDLTEMQALANAYKSQNDTPIHLGSVKGLIGHTGSSAGVAGFIKASLALYNGVIPPCPYFTDFPEETDSLSKTLFIVNTKAVNIDQKHGGKHVTAEVHGFGQGGTNVHVVLRSAKRKNSDVAMNCRKCWLLPLSAPTEEQLNDKICELEQFLSNSNNTASLGDIAYTLAAGRQSFQNRITVCGFSASEWLTKLNQTRLHQEMSVCPSSPNVVFLFPGQGTGYSGIGKALSLAMPSAGRHMKHITDILKGRHGIDVSSIIMAEVNKDKEVAYAQLCLFIIGYCTGKALLEMGCKPSALLGHSVGDIVSITLAECLTIEDALSLLVTRWQTFQKLSVRGSMLAVNAGETETRKLIEKISADLDIAAINSPSQVVVSGQCGDIEAVQELCKLSGIKTKLLNTSHAFHSHLVNPVMQKIEQVQEKLSLSTPKLPLISSMTGTWITEIVPGYFAKHVRETVRFTEAVSQIIEKNTLFIELGTGKTLCSMVKQCYPESNTFPLLKDANITRGITEALGSLWCKGVEIHFDHLFAEEDNVQITSLPLFPFCQKTCMIPKRETVGERIEKPIPNLRGIRRTDASTQTDGDTGEIPNKQQEEYEKVNSLVGDILGVPHQNFGLNVSLINSCGKTTHFGFGHSNHERSSRIDKCSTLQHVDSPDENCVYPIGCLSSLFLLTLHSLLSDQGFVERETKLIQVFPEIREFVPSPMQTITLKHLATHTSGLPNLPPNFCTESEDDTVEEYSSLQLLNALSKSNLHFPPGKQCSISIFGISLLGHALARITGCGYACLVAKHIFQSLHMKSTSAEWTVKSLQSSPGSFDTEGHRVPLFECEEGLLPADGIYTSVQDMCAFIRLMANWESPSDHHSRDETLKQAVSSVKRYMFRSSDGDIRWSIGATPSSTCFVGTNLNNKTAVTIMCNTALQKPLQLVVLGEGCLDLLDKEEKMSGVKRERPLITKDVLKLWTGHVVRPDALNYQANVHHETLVQEKILINETKADHSRSDITNPFVNAPRPETSLSLQFMKSSQPKESVSSMSTEFPMISEVVMTTLSELLMLDRTNLDRKQNETFENMGLDSLQAITLASRISERLRKKVSINDVIRYNTCVKLASHIAGGSTMTSLKTLPRNITNQFHFECTSAAAPSFPYVLMPGVESSKDLVGLLQSYPDQRHAVNILLRQKGALLFRDWCMATPDDFSRMTVALSGKEGARTDYKDGITPRTYVTNNVFTSTEYPSRYDVAVHNEMSYTSTPPRKLLFFCYTPPGVGCGGETSIADSQKVLEAIRPDIRQSMETKGLRYITNSPSRGYGLCKSWQDTFGTDSSVEVEEFLNRSNVTWRWKDDGTLHTERKFPPTRKHPETGATVWFNHAHLFHPSGQPAETSTVMTSLLDPEDMQKFVTYADGSHIPEEHISHIRETLKQHEVVFPWQQGDLLLVDNYLVAHGRRSFTGPRKILMAMI